MQSSFEPRNAGFDALVREGFARQALMRTFGAVLERVEPGCVTIGLDHDPALTQQHGFLHGGVTGAMLDTACGFAALTLMEPDTAVLTVEYKINFIAPAQGVKFRAEGRVIKPGRTLTLTEGHAWALRDGADPVLIATASATLMSVRGRGISG